MNQPKTTAKVPSDWAWQILNPNNHSAITPRVALGGILFWSMVGMGILAFVPPSESMGVSLLRGLGWWLTIFGTPVAFKMALNLGKIEDEPQDLFKGLD